MNAENDIRELYGLLDRKTDEIRSLQNRFDSLASLVFQLSGALSAERELKVDYTALAMEFEPKLKPFNPGLKGVNKSR